MSYSLFRRNSMKNILIFLICLTLIVHGAEASDANKIMAFGTVDSFKSTEKYSRRYTISLEKSEYNDINIISICSARELYAGQPVFVYLNDAVQSDDCDGYVSTSSHGNRVTINPGIRSILIDEPYYWITEPRELQNLCSSRMKKLIIDIKAQGLRHDADENSHHLLFPGIGYIYYSKSSILECMITIFGK